MKKKILTTIAVVTFSLWLIGKILVTYFAEIFIVSWLIQWLTPDFWQIVFYKIFNSTRSGATLIVVVLIGNYILFRKINFQEAILRIKGTHPETYAKIVGSIVVSLILAAGLMANSVHGATYKESYQKYYKYIHGVCYEHYAYMIDCPGLTAAQIHQESLWNAKAKSWIAGGLMQFTKRTWEGETKDFIEPVNMFDPYDSIRVGVAYQKKLYSNRWLRAYFKKKIFKTAFPHRYAAALAGYNGGLGWVLKAMKKSGKTAWQFMTVSSLAFENQFPKHKKERHNYWRRIYRHYNKYYRSFGYPLISFPS